MKSHTLELPQTEAYENSIDLAWVSRLDSGLQLAVRLAFSLLPAWIKLD